jgi:hypothetical protein
MKSNPTKGQNEAENQLIHPAIAYALSIANKELLEGD